MVAMIGVLSGLGQHPGKIAITIPEGSRLRSAARE